jgi:hypothetical protein
VELPSNALHVFFGPLLTLLLMLFLGALLRWTYGTHRQHVAPPLDGDGGDTDDLGLLREVAVVPTAEEAAQLRRRLAVDGIRATVRMTANPAGHRVLVFAKDEADARVVLIDWN